MPRNGSSVYSLPAGNPVIAGTVIATTWANTTLTDIATALTNSLSTDGSTASVSLSGKTMSGGTFSGPAVTGVLTLTGGQIAFPAVQVPSANVNTLDDYEEGTWTPVVTFATPGNVNIAYGTRIGTYTKIGNQVTISFNISTSTFTHTTSSGAMLITGLPFTSSVETCGAMIMGGANVNTATLGSPVFRIAVTTSQGTMAMSGMNNNSATFISTGSHLSGTLSDFIGSATYIV